MPFEVLDWKCQLIEHVEYHHKLYTCRVACFKKVFTKLKAWQHQDYSKVLLLDTDMIKRCPSGSAPTRHAHFCKPPPKVSIRAE